MLCPAPAPSAPGAAGPPGAEKPDSADAVSVLAGIRLNMAGVAVTISSFPNRVAASAQADAKIQARCKQAAGQPAR
jgi:hypothetical protein